ncbi:MAG: PASTA domain-containing protein [Candidatus Caldatribacterium sp.]|nr:PASTA domain-containing protein [Candidatus Caldatribacterium sp.]
MKEREKAKGSHLLEFLGRVFGATFLFGLGLFVSFFVGFLFFERYIAGGSVPVPDVRNMPLLEALNRSARLGFRLEVAQVVQDANVPSLVVLEQDPPPGVRAKRGSRLQVVVNGGMLSGMLPGPQGEGQVILPDVRGKSLEEAQSLLEAQGLRVGRVVEVSHDTLPQGYVISQNPSPRTKLSLGSSVNLLVSAGKAKEVEEVQVPDVVGLRLEEAQEVLSQSGLVVEATEEVPSAERPSGIVVGQDPEGGEFLPRGSGVRLQVARGREQPQPQVEGQKALNLRFVLPSSQNPITVQVVVQDELGERVVYEREHQGEELVEVSASTKGKGKVIIFLNGYYYWEKKLE